MINEERDHSCADSYEDRLNQINRESRTALAKAQSDQPSLISQNVNTNNLFGLEFPKDTVEKIRDSNLPHDLRQIMLTYLIGCWYQDQVNGEWACVPIQVERPTLYLSFGIGIKTPQGSMINVAESAREILEGADLDFKEAFYSASSKVENRPI
ncbi:hypothetical protein [Corynebacterium camporealensis]